jgi:hypothetical protein
MARKPRIDFPGALSHVIARGNRRATLFHDEADYTAYLDRGRKTRAFYVSTSFCGHPIGRRLSHPAPTAPLSPPSMRPIQTGRCDSRSVGSVGRPSPLSPRAPNRATALAVQRVRLLHEGLARIPSTHGHSTTASFRLVTLDSPGPDLVRCSATQSGDACLARSETL